MAHLMSSSISLSQQIRHSYELHDFSGKWLWPIILHYCVFHILQEVGAELKVFIDGEDA